MTPKLDSSSDLARRKAYKEYDTDQLAAAALGIEWGTFTAWRRRKKLPCKKLTGIDALDRSPRQRLAYDYIKAHPWTRLYETAQALGVHSFSMLNILNSLEMKKLIEVCIIKRVKYWALVGTELPPGGKSVDPGGRDYYHTDLPGKITELLGKEAWLPMCLIQKRVLKFGTSKAVETRLGAMFKEEKLQRVLIDSPRRKLYVYALPGAGAPHKEHLEKVCEEIAEGTAFWKGESNILTALKKKPWQTANELAESSTVAMGYVYNVLAILRRRGIVRRVRVARVIVGWKRQPEYIYALKDQPDPEGVPITDGERTDFSHSAKVILAIKELGETSAGEIMLRLNKGANRQITLTSVNKYLEELEELGAVKRDIYGRKAGRVRLSPKYDDVLFHEAETHKKSLDQAVSKLRKLGYDVELTIYPPREADDPDRPLEVSS